jgi:hypothetical protein
MCATAAPLALTQAPVSSAGTHQGVPEGLGVRPAYPRRPVREGDPAIAADDEGYHLSFTAPDELFHDAERLQATASVLLRRVNGLGRVFDRELLPVGLVGRFSDETGQQQQVVLADSAEARDRAFGAMAAAGEEHQEDGLGPCGSA